MKGYTDLEQSKKLAEILPLESADMKWFFWKEEIDAPKKPTFGYSKDAAESYKDTEVVYLPCWSLAALLSVLPKIDNYRLEIRHTDKGYCCCYTEENSGGDLYWYYAYNPVDACVAMIEKLHELNLL